MDAGTVAADEGASLEARLDAAPIALGRYTLLEVIGRGGGGVVCRAYDPELHREVAVKLIHTDRCAEDVEVRRRRLLREAQAAAQLNHPNIVTIYDVGEYADPDLGEGVYLVMELVRGETLERWMTRERRDWREVVRVFGMAGRGLAAAHERGLVHRDFKPSNVILPGSGRPRVVDFGLARAALADPRVDDGATTTRLATESSRDLDPASSSSDLAYEALSSSPSLLHTDVTRHGLVVGTPEYLAPELHRGGPAGPSSDQYAFCVSMFRALAGRPPFEASTFAALGRAKMRPPPVPGRGTVPGWLWRIIQRGLAPRRRDRFPDMRTLLAALERGAVRRRRTVMGLVGAGMVTIGAALAMLRPGDVHPARCEFARAELSDVWDGATRERVAAAFGASAFPFATAAFGRIDRAVADWREEAAAATEAACAPVSPRRPDALATQARALECLERQGEAVASFVALAASGSDAVVRRLDLSAEKLPAPVDCLAADGRVAALEAELAMMPVNLRLDLGDVDGARSAAAALVASAGGPALVAEARLAMCGTDLAAGEHARAKQSCLEALASAEATGDDELAIRVMLRLASAMRRTDGVDAARALVEVARSRFEALPDDARERRLEALLMHRLAFVEMSERRFEDARRHIERAVMLTEADHGPEHPRLIPMLNLRGILEERLGLFDRVERTDARALELSTRFNGSSHPATASMLNNLGRIAAFRGRYGEAVSLHRRTIELESEMFGPWAQTTQQSRANLVVAFIAAGRTEDARTALAELLARAEDRDVAMRRWLDSLDARVAVREGDCARALSVLSDELAAMDGAGEGAELDPDVALALGESLRCAGRLDEAAATLRRVLDADDEHGLAQQVPLAVTLAEVERERGAPGAAGFARAWLERLSGWRGDPVHVERLEAAAAG